MKEIRLSQHAQLKIKLLADRGIVISEELITETIRKPDRLESIEEGKLVAQGQLTDKLVIGVVYREFDAFVLATMVYPGKRSRYERDKI